MPPSPPVSVTPESLLIGGRWQPGAAGFDVVDPATLEVIGRAADAGTEEAPAALDAAEAAAGGWRATGAEERSGLLRAGAAGIRAKADMLAALLTAESGKPLAEARGEILGSARMLEWAAEEGRRAHGRVTPSTATGPGLVLRAPVGPALAITPWNFPASMLIRKVGLALAAGCPLIVKPAEQTPLIGAELIRIVDAAGLPPGVLQCLTTTRPAELVGALLADPRLNKVSFTGSTEVGLHLVRSTGSRLRRVSLEMGGHSPAIVYDDADLESAAAGVVATKYACAGQSCISINRLYVHRGVQEEFLGLVLDKVAQLRLGHGADARTTTGPLIDFAGIEKVERHVADAVGRGASIAAGGHRWEPDDSALKGAFFEPTVLTGADDTMLISSEETFGPVLPMYVFDDEDEVVQRANKTDYGLAAYVYSQGLTRVWRTVDQLNFGVIGVNEPFPVRPELPFGGMKNSGQEREGGSEGIDAYLEPKSVSVRL
ncbi:NAD-dependent succinate-semialdehyde dehydrogenase [Actinomadura madurae]|uniref:NAD-dependent succinate-semialdehyde dehydrogenase n=1 Tax=Actinomadura madurae TaxID=1993 RepID=UPI002025F3C6|nr:NAD-dependent succinate-semialdehyde dehydrogenase [Actinomadura madurae]MCP9972163.1 NAD-dependent succinate-semialdehyde dehydrogenase [Actinomadura madurae]MCP9984667.1 NAD-dependent succinate-semialdehyde dehydrogenase [Actinomadura madurae]MCQ0003781.1 NAD-dependent succinate-semialdehyde dehydrogenase [Actinomadura madurae]MCQ0020860.1 NAD-dependent succinate-semialdehyde dehydrogenase [Actinomadura madurae]URN00880.1 NAD-dependent succinate-semialdehyde dehydrogenase [Actinomadura ma